jgi:hypothetical protein
MTLATFCFTGFLRKKEYLKKSANLLAVQLSVFIGHSAYCGAWLLPSGRRVAAPTNGQRG